MTYVGVLARLLDLEMEEVERAIRKQFARKAKAQELNLAAARKGYEYARDIPKRYSFVIRRMEATGEKVIIDGNSACALGALFAGVTVVTWSSHHALLVARRGPASATSASIGCAPTGRPPSRSCRPRTSSLPWGW